MALISSGLIFFVTHFDFYAVTAFNDLIAHELKIALDFFIVQVTANQTFDFINRVLRVGYLLPAGHLADQAFAVFIDGHDRSAWCGRLRCLR